jgi:signal transduction histidine kinase
MSRIRWKLLTAMIAVVVVTLALSGVFTRRVTHDQVQRMLVASAPGVAAHSVQALEDFHRKTGSWSGVQPAIDRVAADADKEVVLVDDHDRVVATSRALRRADVRVDGDRVTVNGARDGAQLHIMVSVPPIVLQSTPDRVYFLPREEQGSLEVREMAALDRRLLTTFAGALVAAILLTFLISRRITNPIERLTSAVQEMARGKVPAHVSVSGRDEIARLASSFNTMADAVTTQQELRQRMVGDVAHELRTPLTNLRCELEAIQDGLTRPDAPRIASLHEEVLHLQRLVEDLQELAVAEAGGIHLQLQRLDLASTIPGQVHGATPIVVNADPLRINQIMRNLLSNATSHTPPGGGVHVIISSDATNAIVSVTDEGKGIPAEDLEKIFERFYRVDESRARDSGGAGLGLAIVRRLVELHGGKVWAENGAGGGAVFTFTIPLVSGFDVE